MREKAIGIFDSGIGGVSVLNKCIELMPNENFIYYADKKNAPYGDRSKSSLEQLMQNVVEDFFLKHDVKALIIACNTATNATVDLLRNKYSLPIIGIEPAIKPAFKGLEDDLVLVMATASTISSDKFVSNMHKVGHIDKSIMLGCAGLVELIEQNDMCGVDEYLKSKFNIPHIKEVKSVVLGCTHYPFVKQNIQKILGDDIMFYDGGEGVARRTKDILERKSLNNTGNRRGNIEIYNSLNENYNKKIEMYLMKNN